MNLLPREYDYRGNIFSQISFFWIEKLLWKGFRTTLNEKDLYPCPREQDSRYLVGKFEKYWQVELSRENRRPDIKIALAKTLKNEFIISGILCLIEGILHLVLAVLFTEYASSLIENTNNTNNYTISDRSSLGPSLGYATFMSIIVILLAFPYVIGTYFAFCNAIQIQTICSTILFKKVLKLQQSTLHIVSIGHIINLISTEGYKLQFGIQYFNYLWIGPIITVISIILTLFYIGPVGLIGIGYILSQTPLEMLIGWSYGYFSYVKSTTGDIRIQLMDQIIRGMLVIKFYVWESSFMESIHKIRKKEMQYATLAGVAQSLNFALYNTSIFIALFFTYIASISFKSPLTSSQLAFLFLILNKVRLDCIFYFGVSLMKARQAVIILKRIQNILELAENSNAEQTTASVVIERPLIKLEDFSASWKKAEKNRSTVLVLKQISFLVDKVQLVVITGPIGAGKSSLLMSLIKELPAISGEIIISGIVSYTSQQSWIFSGTLRENILFGRQANQQRLQEVIAVCGLTDDIAGFVDGDTTLVGERGVTLSGGQKARVALARAVYQVADIYLLDDSLSAVDMKVGKEIFDNYIRGFLRDKIVVLVTHQIQYVKQADEIVVMKDGSICYQGSNKGVVDNEFCNEFLTELEETAVRETSKISKLQECVSDVNNPTELSESENTNQPLLKFLTEEDIKPNANSLMTYLLFFWNSGILATCVMLCFTILSYGSLYLSYWWMQSMSICATFSNMTTNNGSQLCPWYMSMENPGALVLIFLIILFGSITSVFHGFAFYYTILHACKSLHNRMLHRVLHSPMSFFDTNPSGRILNRFSTDVGLLDDVLSEFFFQFWVHFNTALFSSLAIVIVQYYILIPITILLALTIPIRQYFLKTSTQVKRIESIARSPLYSHISSTLLGLSTIRALKIERRITQDYHYYQDQHANAWFHFYSCVIWLYIRLQLIAAFLVISGIAIALITHYVFENDQLLGFTIPLLLALPIAFSYLVRTSVEVDILMVSTDRVLKYCNLQLECPNAPLTTCYQIPESSNLRGDIQFINLSFKYAQNQFQSLHNISIHVLPGEKVGIMGRTGAGKSSLFNALCRTGDICEGCIIIDSDDITKLNLYQHRKRISVIPQDPVVFSGTLRHNLDPIDEYTDQELWDALMKCNIKLTVECLPEQLMSHVEEDGRNLSTGERQLLCLARAILRNNRIILIDEATANVDMRTDMLVQRAIRTHFCNCTVLTIAHRLDTIIDSDRVLVIDKGRVIEFENPYLMVQNEASYLSKLLSHMDPYTQINLRRLAEMGYHNKFET